MAGIYFHIPFCKTRCPYCDFFSVVHLSEKGRLVEALTRELAIRKDYLKGSAIETVYFGGGTPSLMPVNTLTSLLEKVYQGYPVSDHPEITLECNPDDLDVKYIKELRSVYDFRINLGVQSFDDRELAFLGRRHGADKAREALQILLDHGFSNVGIDLIYGLPVSTSESWHRNLEEAFRFPIQHLSAYHLTIEPGTPFYKQLQKGKLHEISEDKSTRQFRMLMEHASNQGFEHYEISNFARPGYHSRHNTHYWKGIPYLGVGPSAHSFNGTSRQWNVSDLERYIESAEQGKVDAETETLTHLDHFNEYIMTGLRTQWGLSIQTLREKFTDFYDAAFQNQIKQFEKQGWVKTENSSIRLTSEGKFLSDYIIQRLFKTEG